MKESLGANTLVYPTPVWVIATYNGYLELLDFLFEFEKHRK